MNFPLISEYIESIKSAEDNFKELINLCPVLEDDGQPVLTSGNFAVVFKMKDEETGKCYALKCFTKEQEGRTEAYKQIAEELKDVDSPYLVSIRYFDKELFVDTEQTEEKEFPVLLMDWVEGKTLDKYLRENLDDKYALEMLAYRFSQLAQWLIPQSFAHGDLKPDNILVREDGSLVLVDYDGMYVPAMKGQKARELGSPDFRHPLRTESDFDEHIDDFPIISILLSLKTISLNPLLLDKYGTSDRLLFSVNDYRSISESIVASEIQLFLVKEDCRNIMSTFLLCLTLKKLSVPFLKCLCVFFEGLNKEQYDSLSNELKEIISKAVVGDKVAQGSLGYKYYYGEGLPQDYTKAIYWYRASATHGYPVAFYNIGICYQQGTGVSKSYFEAFKWFLKAAEQGEVDAQYNVGIYYRFEKYGIGVNLNESYRWFRKAADQGNANAQDQLGLFFQFGKGGVRRNTQEAFRWYQLAAKQRCSYGQYHVAKCYWNGVGVNRDKNKALEWIKLASRQGNEKAMRQLSIWGDNWWDGIKATYSKDKKTLLSIDSNLSEYQIIEGTEIICETAFIRHRVSKIVIPSSLKTIKGNPFFIYSDNHSFNIISLSSLFVVKNKMLFRGNKMIAYWGEFKYVEIPYGIESIGAYAFDSSNILEIKLPNSINKIDGHAFESGYEYLDDTVNQPSILPKIIVPKGELSKFRRITPHCMHNKMIEDDQFEYISS